MYKNEKVAIIVLDYNKPQMTNKCINSIYSYNRVNIILVNNGSANYNDYDAKIPFYYVKNNTGRAFSKGMNKGLDLALTLNPDYIIFLNNDAIVTKHAIKLLIDSINYNYDIGMVSSNSEYSIGYLNKNKEIKIFEYTKPIIEYKKKLTGFCLCVRKTLINELNGYDEDYIFCKEDDDLSLRIIKKGYKLAEIKNSIVYHNTSSSTNFKNRNDLDFLAYGVGLGYALLSRKHNKNILVQFFLTLRDSLVLFIKTFITSKDINFSIFKSSVKGFIHGVINSYA